VFDRRRARAVRARAARIHAALPAARLGRARSPGDLAHPVGDAREALPTPAWPPREVAAIGITNQRETTVLWERAAARRSHPAIVWQDRRTADRCASSCAPRAASSRGRARTGLLLDPYFSGTKLAWLLDHCPARARAERGELAFGTIDSWLLWQLTGGARCTSPTPPTPPHAALRTSTSDWDRPMLSCSHPAGLPARDVPEPPVTATAALFGVAMPLAGIAGDQQAAPSARPASPRAWPRTPTAPAASC
jgi:glycerol kinase